MKNNYHTHTERCGHACGTDEEYVQAAIYRGLEECGFSDHAPFLFPDGTESSYRIPTRLANEYIASIHALRKKYENDIQIPVGFEMEYYPLYFDDMLAYAKSLGGEYLILGQHYVFNEHPAIPTAYTKKDDVVDEYVKCVIKGMETGAFSYLAHPDLVLNFESKDEDVEKLRPICTRAKELGIPLEINFHGLYGKRPYPFDKFWQMVALEHNDVIFGIDAHDPVELRSEEAEQKANLIVQKYNLHLIEQLELKKI